MAYDSNRANNETAARFQKQVQDQHRKWVDDTHRQRGGAGGQKQGGLLGFVIVVALIAIVAFWIASMQ